MANLETELEYPNLALFFFLFVAVVSFLNDEMRIGGFMPYRVTRKKNNDNPHFTYIL